MLLLGHLLRLGVLLWSIHILLRILRGRSRALGPLCASLWVWWVSGLLLLATLREVSLGVSDDQIVQISSIWDHHVSLSWRFIKDQWLTTAPIMSLHGLNLLVAFGHHLLDKLLWLGLISDITTDIGRLGHSRRRDIAVLRRALILLAVVLAVHLLHMLFVLLLLLLLILLMLIILLIHYYLNFLKYIF